MTLKTLITDQAADIKKLQSALANVTHFLQSGQFMNDMDQNGEIPPIDENCDDHSGHDEDGDNDEGKPKADKDDKPEESAKTPAQQQQ